MKLSINCREATHLVLEGEDRPLSISERLTLRLHMLICDACPKFVQQVAFMRRATGGWRAYRNEGGNPGDGRDEGGSAPGPGGSEAGPD